MRAPTVRKNSQCPKNQVIITIVIVMTIFKISNKEIPIKSLDFLSWANKTMPTKVKKRNTRDADIAILNPLMSPTIATAIITFTAESVVASLMLEFTFPAITEIIITTNNDITPAIITAVDLSTPFIPHPCWNEKIIKKIEIAMIVITIKIPFFTIHLLRENFKDIDIMTNFNQFVNNKEC